MILTKLTVRLSLRLRLRTNQKIGFNVPSSATFCFCIDFCVLEEELQKEFFSLAATSRDVKSGGGERERRWKVGNLLTTK